MQKFTGLLLVVLWLCLIAVVPVVGLSSVSSGRQDELPPPRTAPSESSRQQLMERMVDELASLIPGDSWEQPEPRRRLSALASAFVSVDENSTRFQLKQLREATPDFPPDDLLLAGLSFVSGNPVQGKLLLERAGNAHRRHPGVAVAFARMAVTQGRWYDAQALVQKAQRLIEEAELSPASKKFYAVDVLNLMSAIEIRRNELERARQHVRQWEQLAPDDDQMLIASAEIEFRQQREAEAADYLDRRSESSRDEMPTAAILAGWSRNQGNIPSYGRWIEMAFRDHPDHPRVQLEYAAWLLRQEEFDRAEPVIRDYEDRHGDSNESRVIRGRLAFARQQYDKAEQEFARIYREQPNSFETAYLYTLALLESEDDRKRATAIDIARRNAQLFPDNQLAVACLGWAYWRNKQANPARQLLTRAAEMGEMLPDTGYFLARSMYEDGQATRAGVILNPLLDSSDVFLYRSSAKELVDRIQRN